MFRSRNDYHLSRRDWLRLSSAGVVGYSVSGWLEQLAAATADNPQRKRSCILLWMSGGPSQIDTFDPKPGHANGGPCKDIPTTVPGIRISEHFPQLAKHMERIVPVRSMNTKEADHVRGTVLMRTGHAPGGPIQYPSIGALLSKELGSESADLPNFVSIAPYRIFGPAAFGPGFLGPQFAPLVVGDSGLGPIQGRGQNNYEDALKVQDLDLPGVSKEQIDRRLELLDELERDFQPAHPSVPAVSHKTAHERAVRMMRSAAVKAFELDEEKSALRDAYGRNLFGQGCLLARRLVERGVPFVEVTLSGVQQQGGLGWDTHQQNYEGVKRLCGVLDPAWGTLMEDLKTRGLLDTTLVVWMGEFGRTPKINGQGGRDHWANSWSTVLCGGGLKGGQVVGRTSADGMTVEDRPVSVADFLATICRVLGVDYKTQNLSNVGRPIRIVDKDAKPIEEVIA